MDDTARRLQSIVACAQRLEAQPPYLSGLCLPHTQISNGVEDLMRRPALQSIINSDSVKSKGTTFLGRYEVELSSNTLDELAALKPQSVPCEVLSFRERATRDFQKAILENATQASQPPMDDSIFESFARFRVETKAELHRSLTSPAPPTVSVYGESARAGGDDKFALTEIAAFLAKTLPNPGGNFARAFSRAIRKADGFGLVKPNDVRWKCLSDTFDLIASIGVDHS
jgi:hypothetical protein